MCYSHVHLSCPMKKFSPEFAFVIIFCSGMSPKSMTDQIAKSVESQTFDDPS